MNYIQNSKDFSNLKESYISAFENQNSKNNFELFIPFKGINIKAATSSKKMNFTSFSSVIQGSVLRLKKLFENEHLDLGVCIFEKPEKNSFCLNFELINKTPFIISNEEYFISLIVKYSYEKISSVYYSPVIYRKSCSNGMLALLSNKFKEEVSAKDILNIGCEWTRCNFEEYRATLDKTFEEFKVTNQNKKRYISRLKKIINSVLNIEINESELSINDRDDIDNELRDIITNPINSNRNSHSITRLLNKYISEYGMSDFSILNAMTDFASNRNNENIDIQELNNRNNMFREIAKFVKSNSEKQIKTDNTEWSNKLDWDDLRKII